MVCPLFLERTPSGSGLSALLTHAFSVSVDVLLLCCCRFGGVDPGAVVRWRRLSRCGSVAGAARAGDATARRGALVGPARAQKGTVRFVKKRYSSRSWKRCCCPPYHTAVAICVDVGETVDLVGF